MPIKGEHLVVEALSKGDILSARELEAFGVTRDTLRVLVDRGTITCPAYGLYQSDEGNVPFEQLAVIGKRHPEAVVILSSAAEFHGITQNLPPSITVGVPAAKRGDLVFGLQFPIVEVLRWRRQTDLEVGVDHHLIRGIEVAVTSPARTVVDLWRYSTFNRSVGRHVRVDEETVLDTITRYLDKFDGSIGEIAEMAEHFGVADRMQDLIKGMGYSSGMRP